MVVLIREKPMKRLLIGLGLAALCVSAGGCIIAEDDGGGRYHDGIGRGHGHHRHCYGCGHVYVKGGYGRY